MTDVDNAISLKNVSFGYGQAALAVEDISVDIAPRSTAIIIGPNGSGKTTLMKLMIGLLEPTQGSVEVLSQPPHKVRGRTGYVPQKLDFDSSFPMTVAEFLNFSGAESTKERQEIMQSLGIKKLANSQIGQLSGGQMQRVLIARSLFSKPEILFLDEPASGIDIGGEQSFYELVSEIQKSRGLTVVMVSHQVGLVSQFADQVICINRTLLGSGAPDDNLTPELVEKLFGKDVALHEHRH